MQDPIVEETREARRQLDAEFDGDLEALFVYLQEIERRFTRLRRVRVRQLLCDVHGMSSLTLVSAQLVAGVSRILSRRWRQASQQETQRQNRRPTDFCC